MSEELKPTAAEPTAAPKAAEAPAGDAPAPVTPAVPAAPVAPSAEPAKPATEPAPEKYDLKVPENSQLDAAAIERVSAFAKEKGLSNEEAQSLLERENVAVDAYVKTHAYEGPEWTKRVDGWEKEALTDTEIGGSEEKLKASAELGNRVLKRFFPESVHEFMRTSGFGSHPDLLKGFVRLGRSMSEDVLVGTGAIPSPAKTHAQRIYGGSK